MGIKGDHFGLGLFMKLGITVGLLASSPGPLLAADGLLFTGDWQSNRVRVQDLATDRVVYDLSTRSPAVRDACAGPSWSCYPMGFQYDLHGDRDYLTAALVTTDYKASAWYNLFPTVVARFEMATPAKEVFSVRELDFRDIPNHDAHCAQADDAPFADKQAFGCSIQFAHGFDSFVDNPAASQYSFVIADAFYGRVMGISLDYSEGSQVGHVDFLLGDDTPGWPVAGLPNAAKYYREADGNYLLATFYSNGEISGASAGSVMMFKEADDGSWAKQWQFPDPEAGDESFLHGVHMGQILTDPTSGERTLFYSHGRALASGWGGDENNDLGGSTGVLRLGATLGERPTYMGEGVPLMAEIEGDFRPFRYARDVDFTTDGKLILSDASCENSCPEPGQHFLVEPFHKSLSPSPLEGHFSPTHEEQDLVDLDESSVITTLQCGHGAVFESHWENSAQVGRDLRRATRAASRSCADELPTNTGRPLPSLK